MRGVEGRGVVGAVKGVEGRGVAGAVRGVAGDLDEIGGRDI